jgi:ABC-type uncharacterized transport system YnjBCD ATPase subunit
LRTLLTDLRTQISYTTPINLLAFSGYDKSTLFAFSGNAKSTQCNLCQWKKEFFVKSRHLTSISKRRRCDYVFFSCTYHERCFSVIYSENVHLYICIFIQHENIWLICMELSLFACFCQPSNRYDQEGVYMIWG